MFYLFIEIGIFILLQFRKCVVIIFLWPECFPKKNFKQKTRTFFFLQTKFETTINNPITLKQATNDPLNSFQMHLKWWNLWGTNFIECLLSSSVTTLIVETKFLNETSMIKVNGRFIFSGSSFYEWNAIELVYFWLKILFFVLRLRLFF